MSLDEIPRLLPFIVKEGGFAKSGVKVDLLIAGDAIHSARVGIEDFVVAGPEFEGKIRTNGNESMEGVVVAKRPRQAAQKNHDQSDDEAPKPRRNGVRLAEKDPAQAK